MQKLEIVLGLIEQEDNFILQRRVNERHIGAAGLIGCFGGQIEKGESEAEAVARELSEETSLVTTPEDWKLLTDVEVDSDRDNQPVRIYATAFLYTLVPGRAIHATDGEVVVVPKDNTTDIEHELTPATRALFAKLSTD
jgi:8-oxo-dGTP pyrophosphatase MutT (NUDIX family)